MVWLNEPGLMETLGHISSAETEANYSRPMGLRDIRSDSGAYAEVAGAER